MFLFTLPYCQSSPISSFFIFFNLALLRQIHYVICNTRLVHFLSFATYCYWQYHVFIFSVMELILFSRRLRAANFPSTVDSKMFAISRSFSLPKLNVFRWHFFLSESFLSLSSGVIKPIPLSQKMSFQWKNLFMAVLMGDFILLALVTEISLVMYLIIRGTPCCFSW